MRICLPVLLQDAAVSGFLLHKRMVFCYRGFGMVCTLTALVARLCAALSLRASLSGASSFFTRALTAA